MRQQSCECKSRTWTNEQSRATKRKTRFVGRTSPDRYEVVSDALPVETDLFEEILCSYSRNRIVGFSNYAKSTDLWVLNLQIRTRAAESSRSSKSSREQRNFSYSLRPDL